MVKTKFNHQPYSRPIKSPLKGLSTQVKDPIGGPTSGKRDGVIRHILERENGKWKKKLRYCLNDQSGIQRDWVNLN